MAIGRAQDQPQAVRSPANAETPPAAEAQAPATSLDAATLRELRNRIPAPRSDKTIFSPLDLPTPNRVRNAIGLPGEDYWQQQVDYVIQAKLDAENDALTGSERITYTNNSPTDLPYLWFSLEQNLFRTQSDGSKFTPPGSRFNNRQGFDGGYKIGFVRIDGQDLTLHVYDTLGRLDLPKPVAANGGQVTIDLEWSFNIPDYGADRMGIENYEMGKVYEMAQWFPSVCKFDDVYGWNTLPYLGQGEFYTDFGSYDVTITAPAGHVVCATGLLQNPQDVLSAAEFEKLEQARTSEKTVVIRDENAVVEQQKSAAGRDPLTWHFKADKVRTFAWTSSAATIWDAAGIQWPDGTHTLVQSVYPKESIKGWSESTQMLRHSILLYSDQWFRYPYPSATNVNGICGGMEYPMIIFCGSSQSPAGLHGVTSHEIGHTWFPMVVNSDERRHAWMDEGFNTFINGFDTFAGYNSEVNGVAPPTPSARAGNRRRGGGRFRRGGPAVSQPIDLPADQIRPNLLGSLQYMKTAQGLQLLRNSILGPERFDPAFKLYIHSWAFKSPQPADFYRCMENAAGMNLAWFWREWFIEDDFLDQAIVSVKTDNSQSIRIELANLDQMVMPVFLSVEFEDGSSLDVDLPVYVWYYTNLWTTDIPTGGKAVASVTIDPDNKLPDFDRSNNTWEQPKEAPPEKKAESGEGQ